MDPNYNVWMIVNRPVHEVFEAVADPKELSAYFTTGGASGRLEQGKTVTWDFHDFPGAFPVHVKEVVPDEKIVFEWQGDEPGAKRDIAVKMTFTAVEDGRTKVEVSESGWSDSDAGVKASYGNCMGWSQMLAAMKAWKEYGINLREGAYK